MKKTNALLLAVLLAVLLSGCIGPSSSIGSGVPDTADFKDVMGCRTDWGNTWIKYVAIGSFIAFLLASLYFMASEIIRIPELRAAAKTDFYQALATLVMAASLVWGVQMACGAFDPTMLGLPPADMDIYEYAFSYLTWLNAQIYYAYGQAFIVNWQISFYNSFMMGNSPGGIGVNMSPMAGLSSAAGGMNMLMNAVVVAWITNLAQMEILKYIALISFNVFLPLGLVFRCFKPTRGFGGGLMGLAIGLFIFYPLLIDLNAVAVRNYTQNVVDAMKGQGTCWTDSDCCYYKLDSCQSENIPCTKDNECPSGVCDDNTNTCKGRCQKCISGGVSVHVTELDECCVETTTINAKTDSSKADYYICNDKNLSGGVCTRDEDCISRRCDTSSMECAKCEIGTAIDQSDISKDAGTATAGMLSTMLVSMALPPFLTTPSAAWQSPLAALSALGVGGLAMLDIHYLLELAGLVFMGAIILPVFNFIILVSIVSNLSSFLGEEMDVTNLTRMI